MDLPATAGSINQFEHSLGETMANILNQKNKKQRRCKFNPFWMVLFAIFLHWMLFTYTESRVQLIERTIAEVGKKLSNVT